MIIYIAKIDFIAYKFKKKDEVREMIFSKFERLVAGRYLRSKRKEGFISVITGLAFVGIALGVAALIIVMSVLNGFRQELIGKILGINGHIGVVSTVNYPFDSYDEIVSEVRLMGNVAYVVPMIEKQVLVSNGRSSEGAMLRGVDRQDIVGRKLFNDAFADVNMDEYEGNVIVLGRRLAAKFGVRVGQDLTLISPDGKVTAFGTVPRIKSYKVIGVFDFGMSVYDSSFIFMPLETSQTFFGIKNAVTNIDVGLVDGNDMESVKHGIVEVVGAGAYVYDWKQANSTFFNTLEVERNVMFIILSLIIIVATFNIIASLIMLVKDKGRDIAVLRTMGATKGMIMRIFFIDGAFIGVVGTVLGLILGVVFCDNIESIRQLMQYLTGRELFSPEIYFLSRLPAKMDAVEITTVVVVSMLLSLLATLYPSYRAAKYDPVEALRYE